MSGEGTTLLVLAQTARAARRVVLRLLRQGAVESDIVLVLRSPEDVADCRVRSWDEYVTESDRAAEIARVRDAVDAAAERLRDAFTVHGLFLFDAWRPNFFSFLVDDLVALACVVREALEQEQPSELHVAEDSGGRSWWMVREPLAEVALALAHEVGVPAAAHPGPLLRSLRNVLLRVVALGASAVWAAAASMKALAWGLRGRRAAPPGHRPSVLLALFGASELDIAEDLRRELPLAGCADLQIVDLGFAATRHLARQRGWDVGELAAHTTLRSFCRGLAAPLSTWGVWRRVTRDPAWVSSFAVSGVSLWPAAVPRAWATAMWYLTQGTVHGAIADELIERAVPDVIAMFKRGACVPAGLVLAARRHGISTVYIQHGLLSDTFRTQPSLPHTRFLVFSEYAREQIAAGGVGHDAIEIVGHAGYDALGRGDGAHAELQREQALTDGARHVLLLLTQPDEGLRGLAGGRWIEHAFAAAAQIDGCRVIVKVHPRDTRAAAYTELASATGVDARVVPHAEAKLSELWPICDAVVMGYSTAAFEAIILGKPVVSVNLTGDEDCYPFAETGAALAARRPEEILPVLRAVLMDEETRRRLAAQQGEFVARHIGPLDGQAARRIADIIVGLARRRMADRPPDTDFS